jgi:hypothetical protein
MNMPMLRVIRPADETALTAAAHRARLIMQKGLGALWLLDGLLQLQPGMFTMAMLHNVMQPLAQGQPGWVQQALAWAIGIMTPHVAAWNLAIVVVQLAIGVLLLLRQPRWVRTGLWLSIVWTAVVWLFGEGLGGVLTGSASVLTGAPGSVLLYGWVAVLLLLDDKYWRWGPGFNGVRDGIGIFWGLATLQQLAPVFWTGTGLSSQFQSTAMMQPAWFAATINWAVQVSFHNPVFVNQLLVLIMAGLAYGLVGPRPKPLAFAGEALFLLLIWWVGQGFGMIFTGMATDLNTVPLIALLTVPAWVSWRARQGQAVTVRRPGPPHHTPAAS